MKRKGGFTLAEILVGMAVMGAFVLVLSALLRVGFHATTKTTAASKAQEEVRTALNKIEADLYEANQILVSSMTFVELVCDRDKNPNYNRDADQDGDGIANFRDGDIDNDANLIVSATAQWRIGFNLRDDDDNNDSALDVRLRFYVINRALYKDASYDGSAWEGSRLIKILDDVSSFQLNYYGNKANDLGRNIDLGQDGLINTFDAGENDGIISEREMDMVASPRGLGNRNGLLDTSNEKRYITSVRVILGVDKNRDGVADYQVTTEIYPPLLALKNR